MYLPKHHEEDRIEVLHKLIRSNPLGTWVAVGDGELIANHIPFLVDPCRGEFGTLIGHVARANPVWKATQSPIASVISFQGPQAYITPSWYPSKHEHGKAVPTWNYAVVHVHGQPEYREELDWLHEHIAELTNEHESNQALPWKVDDAPSDFIERLKGLIVGVEIPITRISGKWKTSQNRPEPDKLGVVAGLINKNDPESSEMASLIQQHIGPIDRSGR
ncbi:MAG: FMN-binding negative transcriptional regulator [Gammaproteobacteria bacterium]|nr:FMN-binding negative transcriptional regulator [Gammaproteobacteria bacterium]